MHFSFFIVTWILLQCSAIDGQDDFYFRVSPESQSVRSGQSVRLRCQVSSNHHVTTSWTLDGRPVTNSSRIFQMGSDLMIERVDPLLDSGSFVCTATNVSSGFSIASLPATLTISWIGNATHIVGPSWTNMSLEDGFVSAKQGDNITLMCQVDASDQVHFEWFQNGRKISRAKSFKKWTINQATAVDSGTYTCAARNSAGVARINIPLVVVIESALPNLTRLIPETISVAHDQARLLCLFDPPQPVQWLFNDTILTNSSKYTILDNGTLDVRVTRDSQGWYRCRIRPTGGQTVPEFGSRVKLAHLDDFRKSALSPAPNYGDDKLYFGQDSNAELTCYVPEGIPPPLVWWEGPQNQPITSAKAQWPVSTLTLTRLRPEDSGTYSCHVENMVRKQHVQTQVMVTSAPIIQQHPISSSVNEDEEVIMSCSFIGAPHPATEIQWLKDQKPLLEKRVQPVHGLRNSTLKFQAAVSDAGHYSCLVETHGQQPVQSENAVLHVRERLKFNPVPVSKKVELGSHAKVHCRAQGLPQPIVRWVKEGQPLFSMADHIEDVNGTLHIRGVKSEDRGLYTCIATNVQGIINATVYVDVMVLPHFVSLPDNVTHVRVGHSVHLHCQAHGEPQPTIQWDKGSVLDGFHSDRFIVYPNGTLVIHSVQPEDGGTYGCTAGNSGGFKRAEIHLVVQGWEYSTDDGESIMKTVLITLGAAGAYILLSVGLLMWCRCKRRQRKHQTRSTGENATNGADAILLAKGDGLESVAVVPDSTSVPFSSITTGPAIGKGRFGDVLEGQIKDKSSTSGSSQILIRCLQTRNEDLRAEFKRQIDMFQKVQHPNVAAIIGLCREADPAYFLIDYNQEQILKSYLLSSAGISKKHIDMAVAQISKAMHALAQSRLVHRDLGTRNILVRFHGKDQMTVKVGSFGLEKQPFGQDYCQFKNQLIPVRWLPHEAVFEDEFSSKSDVWMFACTVWELHHGAQQPFQLLSDESVLNQLKNQILQWDASFSQSNPTLTSILTNCWSYDPSLRPSFEQIHQKVQEESI